MHEYEVKLNELKKQLCKLNLAIPGTIHIQYRKCGKASCRCHQAPEHMHGPYYLWYRKVDGKLYTSVIDENDLQFFNEMIENRVKIEVLTDQMLKLGEHYAVKEKLGNKNSKKS